MAFFRSLEKRQERNPICFWGCSEGVQRGTLWQDEGRLDRQKRPGDGFGGISGAVPRIGVKERERVNDDSGISCIPDQNWDGIS